MIHLWKLLQLSGDRRLLVTLAGFLTILANLLIKIRSFDTCLNIIQFVPSQDRPTVTIDDIHWATDIASDRVAGTSCLTSALVAHALCRRHGYPSQLYIGVERTAHDFTAHSWVESQGQVVVGDDVELDQFKTLGTITP